MHGWIRNGSSKRKPTLQGQNHSIERSRDQRPQPATARRDAESIFTCNEALASKFPPLPRHWTASVETICSCVQTCRQAGTLHDNFWSCCTSPARLGMAAFHMRSKRRSRKVPHGRDSPSSLNPSYCPDTIHDAACSLGSKRILTGIAACHSLAIPSQPVTAVRML